MLCLHHRERRGLDENKKIQKKEVREMKKFLALAMVALIAVTAFAVGFTAMASADNPEKSIESGGSARGAWMVDRELGVLNAKVAEILGVGEEQLTDAFRQAWQEVRDDLDEGVNPREAVLSKVADILGITVEQLTDATEQAREELRAEAHERIRERNEERLQNAVENGVITEDEANQIREWWQSRPAALDKLRPLGPPDGRMRGRMQFGNGGECPNT
jgi:transcriptional regulator with XRE-family HTH domain